MNEKLPQTLEIPLSALAELAVEWWRLERWAGGAEASASHARHVARRMGRFLTERELTVLDLTGCRYEPGLAVEVLDVVRDAGAGGAQGAAEVIDEMVSPIVLWRGTVVRHGQVIVRKAK
ncbi:MAG: hypothetical protein H0T60_18020 [Acidobacteria bacterium]|nr:hypothetical protein [Acidobacteriota bacterium]